MKKASFLGLMFTAMSMAFVACSDEAPFQSGDGTGRLAIRLDVNTSAITSRPQTRAFADDGKVAVEDLSLKATAVDGGWTKSWKSIADLAEDNTVDIPVGTHNIEAFFGNDSTEGFGCPYVHGAQQVKINLHETSEVGIVAELKSAMLSFTFDDALNEYLQDYNVEIISSKDNHIVYSPDRQPEAAYVMPGEINLIFNTKKKESRAEGAVEIGKPFAVEAAHHYTIKVSYNEQSAPGNAGITVTFDDALTVDDREINIDLSDQALLTPVPEVTALGFEPGEIIEVARGADHDAIDFNIIAMGGIDEVTIETENWSGILPDWAKTINLTSLEPADQAKYTAMGLATRGLWKNRDKMAVVQMAGLLKNAIANTDEQTPLKFTITVKSGNKVSEPVQLVVKIVDQYVNLTAVDGAQLHRGHNDEYQLMLEYPGTTPQETLRLSYHATNVYATIDNVTYEPAGEGKYLVKFPFDAINLFGDMSQCEFMIEAKDDPSISSKLIILNVLPSEEWSIEPYDIYAKHGYFKVTETANGKAIRNSADIAKIGDLTGEVVTINGESLLKLIDLQDNHAYNENANLIGIEDSKSIIFTTEEAKHLDNGNMEDWTEIIPDGNSDVQKLYYPGTSANTIWGTYNPLTTSQGKKKGIMYTAPASGYAASSGTQPTLDKHSGDKAAYIRTITWGSTNTSGGDISNCKYITQGELFLGTSAAENVEPAYGMEFNSRPLSLNFYAKYTSAPNSDNQDRGVAIITIKDKDENTISSEKIEIAPTNEYQLYTMPLSYMPGTKATSIEIIFRSTEKNSKFLDRKYLHLTFGKLGGTYHYGSELYIDDIELIY